MPLPPARARAGDEPPRRGASRVWQINDGVAAGGSRRTAAQMPGHAGHGRDRGDEQPRLGGAQERQDGRHMLLDQERGADPGAGPDDRRDDVRRREPPPAHAQHAGGEGVELAHAVEERCHQHQPQCPSARIGPRPRPRARGASGSRRSSARPPQRPSAKPIWLPSDHGADRQHHHHGQAQIAPRRRRAWPPPAWCPPAPARRHSPAPPRPPPPGSPSAARSARSRGRPPPAAPRPRRRSWPSRAARPAAAGRAPATAAAPASAQGSSNSAVDR